MGKKQKNQNKKQAKTKKKTQEALDFFSEKKLSRK